jgi:hypothetical protein
MVIKRGFHVEFCLSAAPTVLLTGSVPLNAAVSGEHPGNRAGGPGTGFQSPCRLVGSNQRLTGASRTYRAAAHSRELKKDTNHLKGVGDFWQA